jgi:hypothetical protein
VVRTPEWGKIDFRIISYKTLVRNPESEARNSLDRLRTGLNNIKA